MANIFLEANANYLIFSSVLADILSILIEKSGGIKM